MIDIFCSAEFRDWNCKSIFMRVEDELEIPPAPQSHHFQNWTHHSSSPTTTTAPSPVFLISASGTDIHPVTQARNSAALPNSSLSHSLYPVCLGFHSLSALTSWATRHSVNVIHLFFPSFFSHGCLLVWIFVISCLDTCKSLNWSPCFQSYPLPVFLSYWQKNDLSKLQVWACHFPAWISPVVSHQHQDKVPDLQHGIQGPLWSGPCFPLQPHLSPNSCIDTGLGPQWIAHHSQMLLWASVPLHVLFALHGMPFPIIISTCTVY